MFWRRYVTLSVVFSTLIFSTNSSNAGNIFVNIAIRSIANGIGDGLGSAMANSGRLVLPPQDYSSAPGHREWLIFKQQGGDFVAYDQSRLPEWMNEPAREVTYVNIGGQDAKGSARHAGYHSRGFHH